MAKTYSAYEAKARFSELLRQVRAGQRVIISYHGEEIAELRPLTREATTAQRVRELEERGLLRKREGEGSLRPLARLPGALRRFLESRD